MLLKVLSKIGKELYHNIVVQLCSDIYSLQPDHMSDHCEYMLKYYVDTKPRLRYYGFILKSTAFA